MATKTIADSRRRPAVDPTVHCSLSTVHRPHWVVIPNFVDTGRFRPPVDAEEKRRCREAVGVPADAFVIGCSAAVKKHHKRIDYLIGEFAQFLAGASETGDWGQATGDRAEIDRGASALSDVTPREGEAAQGASSKVPTHQQSPTLPCLLIAGAAQPDTPELVALARELCGDRVRVLTDVPRDDMPDVYRCMDVFVLTSLFEMMPIAVLEALASGLPVVANQHPVIEWMGGEGGVRIDMAREGELAACLGSVTAEWVTSVGGVARRRAEGLFSREAVIDQYIDYYRDVVE